MNNDTIVFTIFLIFSGAAVTSTLALFTRQSLLVGYIILGACLGPYGFQWVADVGLIHQVGEVGIIFLLFLLGLHLHPQNLIQMLKNVTWVALISSLAFIAMGYGIGRAFGFGAAESAVVGAAVMFSSTIIGLKLLPTTILHHQHTGEVMISVLLMQDLIAISVLLAINGVRIDGFTLRDGVMILLGLPGLLGMAFLLERYVLVKLIARFDRTQEYVFLLSIGWCLGMAEFAQYFGLSEEIGAFIAGVSLAASPIALYIAESLKPLRDFFLVMFFFAIGASFDFAYLHVVLLPALMLSGLILVFKPLIFSWLLRWTGESKAVANEVGVRLGQASEFSLLVATLATSAQLVTQRANYLIQATTLITFFVSSYLVVLWYPTPIALSDKMRRD